MLIRIGEVDMRVFLSFILFVSLSATAYAAPPSGGDDSSSGGANRFVTLFNRGGEDGEGYDEPEQDDPRSFTLPAVVAPLADTYGRLTGFAYVSVRVRVASGYNVWSVQEEAHYALDAFVRAAHRVNLSTEDGSALDEGRAVEVWSMVMAQLHGEAAIEDLEIRGFDVRLFRR